MSLARRHRERILAEQLAAEAEGHRPVSEGEGVAITARPRSLARDHKERVLSEQKALAEALDVPADFAGTAEERAAAQIGLRLTHDLRRLKEIHSIQLKIAAKAEMLPEYAAWVAGQVEAIRATGVVPSDDVLPIVMVWRIDTGDYAGALELAEVILENHIPLPARYERAPATLIVEEIADAALKLVTRGEAFDLDTLTHVHLLTDDIDMHDEVRAKLFKATGCEMQRQAEVMAPDDPAFPIRCAEALAALTRARELNERSGVKARIEKLQKLLAPPATNPPA